MTRAPHSAIAIDAALQRGDAALIAYLPVGFPSVEDSIRAGKVLADVGVDAIELGFPYSDPGMDGPTIQRATVAALERGTHLEDLFHAVDELTSYGVSTCSMTYWNPVEWWGVERFAKDFAAVGRFRPHHSRSAARGRRAVGGSVGQVRSGAHLPDRPLLTGTPPQADR